jgi:lysophospholipase L1-like esterase
VQTSTEHHAAEELSGDLQEPPTQPAPKRSKPFPAWVSFLIAANGLLMLGISLVYWKPQLLRYIHLAPPAPVEVAPSPEVPVVEAAPPTRSQLTYEQWLTVLGKEAKATAQHPPDRLTVLLGDSLSLWFPPELLPADRAWLNQGISGESSTGLSKRLNLLDGLEPQTIFVMVGVNDLIKGGPDAQVVQNLKQMVQTLKQQHPKSELVLQSLLPHGDGTLVTVGTAEDREGLLKVSNERIYQLNQKISAVAAESEVRYLDLYPLFVDGEGVLRSELSTDGLHLNRQGYWVWRSALQTFSQLALKPPEPKSAPPKAEASAEASPAAPAEVPQNVAPDAKPPAAPAETQALEKPPTN